LSVIKAIAKENLKSTLCAVKMDSSESVQ